MMRMRLAALAVVGTCVLGAEKGAARAQDAPGPGANEPGKRSFAPVVKVRDEDYVEVRRGFRTKLLRRGPSPQEEPMPRPPAGVEEVEYRSGELRLRAWMNPAPGDGGRKRPAVVFVHGGFAFGLPDWEMTAPYREAGFVVMAPWLRGENGQAGSFTLVYDEVEDVLAAADDLAGRRGVDPERIYVAGHSSGGTLALLAALASRRFRAVAALDATPDLAVFFRPGQEYREVPFDPGDRRELEVRSPLAYARSLKCPARLYYSEQATPHLEQMTLRFVEVAKGRGLDAGAERVHGNHISMAAPAARRSIDFFRGVGRPK
jgi:acetyl esterase/lipase